MVPAQQPYIPTFDPEAAQQAQAYVPGGKTTDKEGKKPVKYTKDGKRETVIRKAGGKVWEDRTLVEWDPCESTLEA